MRLIPAVSVIVPLHNGQRYLSKCIKSILGQTFTNFELILVNDGSTDISLEICERFAGKDDRITIVDKRNEGVAYARRDGFQKAKGEYILFVDSDDYIEPRALEVVMKIAEQHHMDVVVGTFDRVLESWGLFKKHAGVSKDSDKVLTKAEIQKLFIGGRSMIVTMPTMKLYRTNCFRKAQEACGDILFPQDNMPGEDRFMNLALAPFMDSGWITNEVLYHYRRGGVTTKYFPLIKRGGWYFDVKYDMCRQYRLDYCLPDVFSYYMDDLFFDIRQQLHGGVNSDSELRDFNARELSTRKIVFWAKENLLDGIEWQQEASALLRHDVDGIVNIARHQDKAMWKHYLQVRCMRLFQRVF